MTPRVIEQSAEENGQLVEVVLAEEYSEEHIVDAINIRSGIHESWGHSNLNPRS
jgi:rhodanese-related sulfurtransferase